MGVVFVHSFWGLLVRSFKTKGGEKGGGKKGGEKKGGEKKGGNKT